MSREPNRPHQGQDPKPGTANTTPAAAAGVPQRREDAPAGRRAGLVSTSTSVTLVAKDARLKRMKRGLLTASRLIQEDAQRGGFRYRVAMLTLTYRPETPWNSRHVTHLIRAIREYLRRRGFKFRYAWVLETTKAGKPHYHLLLWLPRGLTLPKPDKRGWWPHGHTRIEWARNALGYLAKYASKGFEHGLPRGARLYGCGGLSLRSRLEKTWWLAPSWVREQLSIEDRPARAPGGGWISRRTGEWFPSPWRLVARAANWSWCRFERVPVPVTRALSAMGGTPTPLEGAS